MTIDDIIRVFIAQHPNAVNAPRDDLELMLSQYVVGSYVNAMASINARKALGLEPRKSEQETRDLLSQFLHDVTPLMSIFPHAYMENGKPVDQVPDPSAMNFDEYSSWRKSQPTGSKGLFD